MARFFLPRAALTGESAVLTGGDAAHARVLRLQRGEAVTLSDGEGTDYACTVEDTAPGQIRLRIVSQAPSAAEPRLRVSVFLAYAKSDKVEHVIQKATELGAWEIVAFPSARCVSRPDGASLLKKLARWQRIAASAAEQSGRGRIPPVRTAESFAQAVAWAAAQPLAALFYENERRAAFRAAVAGRSFAAAALMTGPEGGFTPEEVRAAREAGMLVCSLGPRILRCETAPLCALSALLFAAGELD